MGVVYQPHQIKASNKLVSSPRGGLVYHGLGSGKTLTAIRTAEQYGGAIVILPASLADNFRKELKKAGATGRYEIYSYAKYVRNPVPLDGKVVILDEAHRIRNSSGKTAQSIRDSAKYAKKVIMLTGTPILNKPYEVASLINTISGSDTLPISEKAFNSEYIGVKKVYPGLIGRLRGISPSEVTYFKNRDQFQDLTKGMVSYYGYQDKSLYPSVESHLHKIPMTKDQERVYRDFERQHTNPSIRWKIKNNLPPDKSEATLVNRFMMTSRQLTNSQKKFTTHVSEDTNPKVSLILKDIKRTGQPTLVYSNFLGSGIDLLKAGLEENHISYGLVTGRESRDDKTRAVNEYNSGLIRVLIISTAGSEGLDLKNTRNVHILEPHWNQSKLNQVVGRAARYQSHIDLPEDQRKVKVHTYLSTKRNGGATADTYLHHMSEQKESLNRQFLSALQQQGV